MITTENADLTLHGNGGSLSITINRGPGGRFFDVQITGGCGRDDVAKPIIFFDCEEKHLMALAGYLEGACK